MNCIIFELAKGLTLKMKFSRATFYRHRRLLDTPCREIAIQNFFKSKEQLAHLESLCLYSPLLINDIEPSKLNIHRTIPFHKLPSDPNFFRFLKRQMNLWNAFKDKTLREFIQSSEGQYWFKRRRLLKRRPLFELDAPYKVSKRSALAYELKVRSLLRKYPLLRWEDLKALGVKNAQPIYQRFPQRALYRERLLKKLQFQIDTE